MLNFLFRYKYKKIVQDFIVRMYWTKFYIASLMVDHESDEIREQMLLYKDIIIRKTQLSLNWPDPDNWKDIEGQFWKAMETLDYCKEHLLPSTIWQDDKYEMIKKFVSTYGKFNNHEELLLKAEIAYDKKMIDALS